MRSRTLRLAVPYAGRLGSSVWLSFFVVYLSGTRLLKNSPTSSGRSEAIIWRAHHRTRLRCGPCPIARATLMKRFLELIEWRKCDGAVHIFQRRPRW